MKKVCLITFMIASFLCIKFDMHTSEPSNFMNDEWKENWLNSLRGPMNTHKE